MVIKPILFSGPMVRAILEGRKTMTRRIVQPQPKADIVDRHLYVDLASPKQPGDILWVRETWGYHQDSYGDAWPIFYRADYPEGATTFPWGRKDEEGEEVICDLPRSWRPSIFMPKEAARLFLRVTAVRVERLQEISDADAIREGANCDEDGRNVGLAEKMRRGPDERFRDLWDSINGKRAGGTYAWNKNPWVWVITFERVDKPAGWPEV